MLLTRIFVFKYHGQVQLVCHIQDKIMQMRGTIMKMLRISRVYFNRKAFLKVLKSISFTKSS